MQGVMHALLERGRWPVLLAALALCAASLAYYQPTDLQELQFTRSEPPAYGLLVAAATMLAAAMALLLRDQGLHSRYRASTRREGRTLTTCIGQCAVEIVYGRVEEVSATTRDRSLVVLPANECFDDDCINDTHSALGAFVQTRMRGTKEHFSAALAAQLKDAPASRTDLAGRRRFPLGTSVHLNGDLEADGGHLLISAATERLDEGGLRGDLGALFTICRTAYGTAREARLDHVVMPLMGAGHGSIGPARALLAVLLAWCEVFYRESGYQMRATIVILEAEGRPPALAIGDAKELLSIAAGVTSPLP